MSSHAVIGLPLAVSSVLAIHAVLDLATGAQPPARLEAVTARPCPDAGVGAPDAVPGIEGRARAAADRARPTPSQGTASFAWNDRNAAPEIRVTPIGYRSCFHPETRAPERVGLKFDVRPDGRTTNIEITTATDMCFARAARRAVAQWRYEPRRAMGRKSWRYGVEAELTFERKG